MNIWTQRSGGMVWGNNRLWARRYLDYGMGKNQWMPCPYGKYLNIVNGSDAPEETPYGDRTEENNGLWARRHSDYAMGRIMGCGHGDIQIMAWEKISGCRAPTVNI